MAHDLEKKSRTNDVLILENADFSSLLLRDRVLSGLTKAGFKKPSPIQLEAIPCGRFGKDLWVQAKSGTGKTLVFVIVALEMLLHKLLRPQVLILVPTREIAAQIHSVIKNVGSSFRKLKSGIFIGGLPVADDIKKAHDCQIAVGTPGRIKQLITLKALPTSSIRLMVFDEADELLEYSWQEDIEAIFNTLPEEKQVIATSATYPPKLKRVMLKYLRDPYIARLDSKKLALLGIIHYAKIVESSSMSLKQYDLRCEALKPILKTLNFTQCLVFCNGIHKVETLYREIKKWGFSATFISSNRSQTDRLKAIECLKRFKCKVLVSSDVTARGIDAENVDLVINFDFSNCIETYVHRSGRAGRYGTTGVTISILDAYELQYLNKIENTANFKTYILPDPLPVDLIQNPSFDKYVFENSNEENEPEEEEEESVPFTNQPANAYWKNEANKYSVSLEHIQDNSEFSMTGNLEASTVCDDTNKSSKTLEVKSDSVNQSKGSVKDSQDLNFEVSSPKVSSIISSVLNECKESNISIPLPLENLFIINESSKVSDVESKVSVIQSDNGHESTFRDANLKSPVYLADKTDLDLHNNEFSKVVETFVNHYEANSNRKNTDVLSNKEEPEEEDKKPLELIQDNSEFSINGSLEASTICDETTKSSKSLEVKSDSVRQSKGSVKDNQHLNFEVSSAKVSSITSSVLHECKESDASIALPLENLTVNKFYENLFTVIQSITVNESIEVSDVESKVSVIQSDNGYESTFPNASLKSPINSADKTDLHIHNNEFSKVVETFVNNYEANRNRKNTNVLSNKESLVTENFETDTILTSDLTDLNSKRSDYYYKVCKLFLEENACSNSESKMQESLEKTQDNESEVCKLFLEENACSKSENKMQESLEKTQDNESEFCTKEKAFLGEANDEEILKKSQKTGEGHQFVRASENLKELSDNSTSESDSIPNYEDNPDLCEMSCDEIAQYCDKSRYKVTTLFDRSSGDKPLKCLLNSCDELSEESNPESDIKSDGKASIDTIHCSSEESESCSDSDSESSESDLSSTSSSEENDSSEESEESDSSEDNDGSEALSFSSTSERKFVRGNKKMPVHCHYTHSSPQVSAHGRGQQLSHSRFENTYPKHHHSSHVNACQQPNFPRCLSTHQDAYNSEHFPVCHHSHKSLSSESKKYRSRKKYDSVHKKHQPSCASSVKEQYSPLCFKPFEQNCHPYNACQQSHFPRCCNTHQGAYNSEHFPVCHHSYKSSSSECKKNRSRKEYDSVHKKNQLSCTSNFNEQHSCFRPSEHRCHPYNADIDCNHREICAQWYEIFCNQWMHINRLSHFTT